MKPKVKIDAQCRENSEGRLEVGGTIDLYFEDVAVYEAWKAGESADSVSEEEDPK